MSLPYHPAPMSSSAPTPTSSLPPSPASRGRPAPRRPQVMTHHYSHPGAGAASSPTLTVPPAGQYRTPNPLVPTSSPLSFSDPAAFSPSSLSPSAHFGVYPGSLPTQAVFPSRAASPLLFAPAAAGEDKPIFAGDLELDMGFDLDFDPLEPADRLVSLDDVKPGATPGASMTPLPTPGPSMASPSKKRPIQPPRPPNAWILYRSDKLKAIAAGEQLPNLDGLLAESGVSGGSASASSAGEESSAESKRAALSAAPLSSTAPSSQVPSPDAPAAPAPKTKKKKAKKGAKEPTEGMLALGKGKTGRGLPQADISKMISMLWKRETPEVRTKYERLSELKKLEHLEKYPGYKFQPLRKADKLNMREEREREREREREVAKQEKELQRSANRGARRSRARTRVSPTSLPYTSRPAPLGRSLSYGGRSPGAPLPGAGMFLAESGGRGWHDMAAGHDWSIKAEPTALPDEEEGLRSYPFPIPPGALPSMKPEDHADNPYIDVGTGAGSAGVDSMPSSLPHHDSGSSSQAAPGRQQWLGPPLPSHMFASGQGDMAPPAAWANVHGTGMAYAVPYIFEPIPIPGDEAGASAYDRQGNVDELAATWCLLEEDSAAGATIAGPGPSTAANFAHDGLFHWDAEASAAVERWDTFDDNYGSLGLSTSIAEQIAAGWASQHIDYDQAPLDLYPGVIESSGFANVALTDHSQLAGFRPAMGDDGTGGPFLSAPQPLSPLDSWSVAASTPRDHLRPSVVGNTDGREPAGGSGRGSFSLPMHSPGSPAARIPSTSFAPPRHVSASAYPTPASAADPGLGAFTWDRQPSLSFPEMPQALGAPHDDIAWDDDDDAGVGAPGRAAPPMQQQQVQSAPPHRPVPPRGARRGRTVAAQFNPGD